MFNIGFEYLAIGRVPVFLYENCKEPSGRQAGRWKWSSLSPPGAPFTSPGARINSCVEIGQLDCQLHQSRDGIVETLELTLQVGSGHSDVRREPHIYPISRLPEPSPIKSGD
ncbi:hypothetical protein RRG08_026760 [Elysia crispata]|uniref:Uncharacterized protein n=1 Tax=Elysia crispata TaxID=231223 RepID=A0AAE1APX9_9GAST|nr:hypothetical protein RRG08_026760 [Elysia crispata]